MAITFVGAGSSAANAATTINPGWPTGLQVDDVVVLFVVERGSTALSLPGWTIKAATQPGTGSPGTRLTVAWKRITASDNVSTPLAITHGTAELIRARMFGYRGVVKTGDPFEAFITRNNASAAGAGSWGALNLTTSTPGALWLHGIASADDQTGTTSPLFTSTSPAGLTGIVNRDDWESTAGSDGAGALFEAVKTARGMQTGLAISFSPTAAAVSGEWAGALTPELGASPYLDAVKAETGLRHLWTMDRYITSTLAVHEEVAGLTLWGNDPTSLGRSALIFTDSGDRAAVKVGNWGWMQYITTPTMDFPNELAIEFVIKVHDFSAGCVPLSLINSTTGAGIVFYVSVGGDLQLEVYDDLGNMTYVYEPGAIVDEQTYYLGCYVNAITGDFTLYVDGEAVQSSFGANVQNAFDAMVLTLGGRFEGDSSNPADCTVDAVSIYDDQPDFRQHYERGTSFTISGTGALSFSITPSALGGKVAQGSASLAQEFTLAAQGNNPGDRNTLAELPPSVVEPQTVVQPEPEPIKASRNYRVILYESNLFNTDVHPISGLPTPGIHTKVRQLTQARNLVIEPELNRPGNASFSVPITSLDAGQIAGKEIVRCVLVLVDTEPGEEPEVAFSGPLWNITLNGPSATLEVACVGWGQFLYGREMRQQYIFNEIDAGIIGTRLLATANNQVADEGALSDGRASEDLLFGKGECDSMLGLVVGGSFDSTYPKISTAWSASGSGSLHLSSTNKNAGGYVTIGDRYPVDVGTSYQMRTMVNIASISGTANAWIHLKWYTDGDIEVGTGDTSALLTTVGEHELVFNSTAPATAAYGRAIVGVSTGAVGSIAAYFDAVYVSPDSVNVVPTPIEIGEVDYPANPSGADRTRTYAIGQKIGQQLEELSQIESGFDFEVAMVKQNPSGLPGGETYRRMLNIKWSLVKIGTTIRGIGQDRPDVIWGYRWTKKNLSGFVERSDSSKLANRINTRAPGKAAMAVDRSSVDTYSLWEDSINVSDQGISPEVLLGYAGAETAFRAHPLKTFNPTPFPYDGTDKVPRWKVDYDVGDIVYAVADHGALQVGLDPEDGKQPMRLFGLRVEVQDNGTEKISNFKTAASS